MESVRDSQLCSNFINALERIQCIILPRFASRKYFCFNLHPKFLGVVINACHIFCPYIYWLVKNSNGLKFRNSRQCCCQIRLVALGIRRRNCHINV